MRHIWKIIFIVLLICYGLARQDEVAPIVTSKQGMKTIEVKGAVHNPGVYKVPWDTTVEQALQYAGGASEHANLSAINQTRNLEQGEVLIVPEGTENTCISINSATIEELDTLSGIGEKMAQRIIDERTKEPFYALEDIKRVKGVGDKLFEKMKDQICL